MITKRKNHDHYWVDNKVLYESYRTIRGLRFQMVCQVDMEDNDRLTDEEIKSI